MINNHDVKIVVYSRNDSCSPVIIDFDGEIFKNDFYKLPLTDINQYPVSFTTEEWINVKFNPGFYIFEGKASLTDILEPDMIYIYNGSWKKLPENLLQNLMTNGYLFSKES